ncbi:unnamed protein product [Hydatigera taeniaeformis]|uniref:Testis-expressed sequence 264 protein n=1 Tax=Hydatigena taeniaeformis TaxID=6205 RepID=A0A0R3WL69_HYDTA|nr:unnamed protein product [Hydatigera taeniaeformis]
MPELLIVLVILISFLLLWTIAALCYISGIFRSVDLSISSEIPYLKDGAELYYKANFGSYGSLGGLFTEAYSIAPGVIQCGIYYDDSGRVAAKDCRSAVGVILTDGPADVVERFEKHGFKKFLLPPIKEALYESFPHVSFLSIFIGIWKVLPLLRKMFKEFECSGFTYIEVYDDSKIHYIGILDNNVSFLVPDFADTNKGGAVPVLTSELEQGLDGNQKTE